MIAKKQAKKGMATRPNSTAALPVSLLSKRLAIGKQRRPIFESSVPMKTSRSFASGGQERECLSQPA
jgi:hypothetical protein